jgi:hypothetical protein
MRRLRVAERFEGPVHRAVFLFVFRLADGLRAAVGTVLGSGKLACEHGLTFPGDDAAEADVAAGGGAAALKQRQGRVTCRRVVNGLLDVVLCQRLDRTFEIGSGGERWGAERKDREGGDDGQFHGAFREQQGDHAWSP